MRGIGGIALIFMSAGGCGSGLVSNNVPAAGANPPTTTQIAGAAERHLKPLNGGFVALTKIQDGPRVTVTAGTGCAARTHGTPPTWRILPCSDGKPLGGVAVCIRLKAGCVALGTTDESGQLIVDVEETLINRRGGNPLAPDQQWVLDVSGPDRSVYEQRYWDGAAGAYGKASIAEQVVIDRGAVLAARKERMDERAWASSGSEACRGSKEIEAPDCRQLLTYMKNFPKGAHLDEAAAIMEAVMWADAQGAIAVCSDEAQWLSRTTGPNCAGIRRYLDVFADGAHGAEARRALELAGVLESKSNAAKKAEDEAQGRAFVGRTMRDLGAATRACQARFGNNRAAVSACTNAAMNP